MALLCVVGVLVAGCGSSGNSTGTSGGPKLGVYPSASEQNFLSSCVREATLHASKPTATRYCRTALACIEQKLSFQDFRTLERNLLLGRSNPNAKAVLQCVKSARQQVLGSDSSSTARGL
jgi:hypothetical protein